MGQARRRQIRWASRRRRIITSRYVRKESPVEQRYRNVVCFTLGAIASGVLIIVALLIWR